MGGCSELYQPAHKDAGSRSKREGDVEQSKGASAQRLPCVINEGRGQQEGLRKFGKTKET